jgi:putative NADH-flavin reductase
LQRAGVGRLVVAGGWTYISPAALLEPGARTGTYRVGVDQLLVEERGRSRIVAQ